ncbi:hypothetical protein AB9G26_09705 [Francisella philomiragia]|uniref:hypothetical protein n=1 Tax=Francisella philomiragia TaxID=28110 RepID=UPI003519980C
MIKKLRANEYDVYLTCAEVGKIVKLLFGIGINKTQFIEDVSEHEQRLKLRQYENVRHTWQKSIRGKDLTGAKQLDLYNRRRINYDGSRYANEMEQKLNLKVSKNIPLTPDEQLLLNQYDLKQRRTYFNMDRDNLFEGTRSGKTITQPLTGLNYTEAVRPLRIAMGAVANEQDGVTAGMCQEIASTTYSILRRLLAINRCNVSYVYNSKMVHYYVVVSVPKHQNLMTRNLEWKNLHDLYTNYQDYTHIVVDPWITEVEPYATLLEDSVYQSIITQAQYYAQNDRKNWFSNLKKVGVNTEFISSKKSKGQFNKQFIDSFFKAPTYGKLKTLLGTGGNTENIRKIMLASGKNYTNAYHAEIGVDGLVDSTIDKYRKYLNKESSQPEGYYNNSNLFANGVVVTYQRGN